MLFSHSRWLGLGAMICAGGLALSSANAQATAVPFGKRQLVGAVRDPAGAALEGVAVAVAGTTVRTDARGRFQVQTGLIDTVTISIRHVGFEPIDALLTARDQQWDTVLVQLEPSAQRLRDVSVTEDRTRGALELRNFEARRAQGIGQYVTREEIVERGSSRLSDVLRTKRGIYIARGGKIRFSAYSSGRSARCQPDVWIDGHRSQGMEVEDILPSTVEAIELYPSLSAVPAEFQAIGANTTPCGTIVIWTRVPNGKKR